MSSSTESAVSPGFTPGTWVAANMVHAERGDQMTPEEIGEYVANSVRLGSPDRFLFITTSERDAPDICHVGNGPNGPANAHLIAAAPDLYEALRDLRAATPGTATLKAARAKADAALAKAEGRSDA